MASPVPLPWQQIMEFGFGKLNLTPQAFWTMSLPELNAALRFHFPERPLPDRAWLDQVQQDFPDHPHTIASQGNLSDED